MCRVYTVRRDSPRLSARVGNADLRIGNEKSHSQIRSASHADGADVRPRLPDQRTPTVRDASCRSPPDAIFGAARCQAGGGTASTEERKPQSSVGKLKQRCFSLPSPCAPLTPFGLGHLPGHRDEVSSYPPCPLHHVSGADGHALESHAQDVVRPLQFVD